MAVELQRVARLDSTSDLAIFIFIFIFKVPLFLERSAGYCRFLEQTQRKEATSKKLLRTHATIQIFARLLDLRQ